MLYRCSFVSSEYYFEVEWTLSPAPVVFTQHFFPVVISLLCVKAFNVTLNQQNFVYFCILFFCFKIKSPKHSVSNTDMSLVYCALHLK